MTGPVVSGRRAAAMRSAGLFALGVLAAAGQAPLGWWGLSLLALGVFFAFLPLTAGSRIWAVRSWLAGSGYFAASLFWIVEPFLITPKIHGWMAPFALTLMAGGMALFWGLAGGAAAWLTQGRARLVALVILLVVAEMLRGWVFTGFPWAMVGHGLIGTPLMQLAALAGAGGLSLLMLVAAVLPALSHALPGRLVGGAAALALLGTGWLWGSAQTDLPPDRDSIVRLAQPNVPQSEKWREDLMLGFFNRLLDQTALPADPAPDLVVWPETAVPFLLEYPGEGMWLMADATALQGPDTRLAFGVQRGAEGRYFNSLAVLTAGAEITDIYDKHHLVPFGEYIPLGEWLMGTPIGGLAGPALMGYSPGPGPALLDLGALGTALPLICYEAIFPRHLRTATRPDWILQITNDAWFGNLSGPFQHLAQAQLRAVEQGLPVLRAANTGVSAFIDARGNILGTIALNKHGTLDGAIPGALPPTFYARHGDWPVIAALALMLLMALGADRLIRRRYSAG